MELNSDKNKVLYFGMSNQGRQYALYDHRPEDLDGIALLDC